MLLSTPPTAPVPAVPRPIDPIRNEGLPPRPAIPDPVPDIPETFRELPLPLFWFGAPTPPKPAGMTPGIPPPPAAEVPTGVAAPPKLTFPLPAPTLLKLPPAAPPEPTVV